MFDIVYFGMQFLFPTSFDMIGRTLELDSESGRDIGWSRGTLQLLFFHEPADDLNCMLNGFSNTCVQLCDRQYFVWVGSWNASDKAGGQLHLAVWIIRHDVGDAMTLSGLEIELGAV